MDWREFEDKVREVLRHMEYVVTDEVLLGSFKVDAYAEKTFGLKKGKEKIGVECKYYERKLGSDELIVIYSKYIELIENKLIDYVLVVTSKGLSPQAEARVLAMSSIEHMTLSELEDKVLDFSTYLSGITQDYKNKDLHRTYIKQRGRKAKLKGLNLDIENYIINWSEESTCQPLAILGGYGIGKSTLAIHLAHTFIEKRKHDMSVRIPILIKLSDLVDNQRIEGLLGYHFTAGTKVGNYDYHTFKKFNDLGKFVIFLDGFDEMKKSISADILKHNFSQLLKLYSPKSKLIFLGRPTAFSSDEEQREILGAEKKLNGQTTRIPDWPEFEEIELLPFNLDQIQSYLANYKSHGDETHLDRLILNLAELVKNPSKNARFMGILTRPVQLQMLVKILPYYQGELDDLTISVLYSQFIDLILRRETVTGNRGTFTETQRKRFSQNLAFWMWRSSRNQFITIEEIPDILVLEFAKPEDKIELLKRNLLRSSFLDAQHENGFYFPHKSFQEFLVAESILNRIKPELDNPFSKLKLREEGKEFVEPTIVYFLSNLIGLDKLSKMRDYFKRPLYALQGWEISFFMYACSIHDVQVPQKLSLNLSDKKFRYIQKEVENTMRMIRNTGASNIYRS